MTPFENIIEENEMDGEGNILKYIVIKWLSKEWNRMDKTLEYYNQNAKHFTSTTQSLEFSQTQDKFWVI